MQARSLHGTIAQWIIILLFVGVLWVPFVGGLFGLDQDREQGEKRKLAAMPELPGDLAALERFPAEFEGYYNDHFGFRNRLIRMHNRYQKRLFKDSSGHRVLVGKDGWLFYKDDRVLEDYRATEPFTREELRQWQRVLEERRDWLEDRGIEYMVFVAPNKHTIYSEFIPDYIQRTGRKSRLDQLIEHMKDHSDFLVLDLRPALFEAKEKERIYHRLGTHWNDLGAYTGYRTLMETLSPLLPGLRPLGLEEFEAFFEKEEGMDLVTLIALEDELVEDSLNLKLRRERPLSEISTGLHPSFCSEGAGMCRPFALEQDDESLPKAVIFRDSFFTALVRFVSLHFRRSAYYWQYEFDCAVIEHEKPDVVIQEYVERSLMTIKPENPEEVRRR